MKSTSSKVILAIAALVVFAIGVVQLSSKSILLPSRQFVRPSELSIIGQIVVAAGIFSLSGFFLVLMSDKPINKPLSQILLVMFLVLLFIGMFV